MFDTLIQAFESAKTVMITAHVGPDGDTLGSMLGLKFALEKAKPHIHRVDCLISGKMPDNYRFMPGIKTIHRFEDTPQLLEQYDMAISVDCGSIDRLGPNQECFKNAKVSVNIDHHISNDHFGSINVIDTAAAASGEVVFDLLKAMKIPMDANIATCLYTAIVTDTGGFKYSNTTSKVLEVSAQLVSAGASPDYVFKQLYEEQPLPQMRLQAQAFLNTEFNDNKTLAWTTVSREMLAEHNALDEHVDGLVEMLRRIDTVLISVVFKEAENGFTRVSSRSDRYDIDVASVMQTFDGGGHKLAAGCTVEKPLSQAIPLVLARLEEALTKKQKAPQKA